MPGFKNQGAWLLLDHVHGPSALNRLGAVSVSPWCVLSRLAPMHLLVRHECGPKVDVAKAATLGLVRLMGWLMVGARPIRPDDAIDAALMGRLAAGDQQALAGLYDRHGGLLLGLGMRIVGSRAEAEDVLHDVFVEVWKRAADFDAGRGTVRNWLAIRMRSRCLDRQKSPRVARRVPLDDDEAARIAAPDRNPLLRLERAQVRAALQDLPDEQRVVVELAYFQGLSTREIGDRVGIAQGTVKSRLFAARAKLARVLAGSAANGGEDVEQ